MDDIELCVRFSFFSGTSDGILVQSHLENHPCCLIIFNDVETSKDSVIKRIIVMHVHNQVGADRGKELVPWVRRIQKNMSNAWYRKYAGMLFPKLKECVRRMITGALNMLIFVVLLMQKGL